MARTATHPPDDPRMWRRVLKRLHPDAGGDAEAFVWAGSVRELVCATHAHVERNAYPRDEHARAERDERVPYDPALGHPEEFARLTNHALVIAYDAEPVHRAALALLADCDPEEYGPAAAKQRRGATYKQLAAVAHRVGMSKPERVRWYETARSVPLSERHASHVLGYLGRSEAA